jgi:aryl-alcohol dehydrogenase-like predicted oxidoreductase
MSGDPSPAPGRRIAIGTAQFGLPYGIANKSGKVAIDEAGRILEAARAAGIDTLDTAVNYGDSEACLGELGVGDWKVVSKLPAVPEGVTDVEGWAMEAVASSLERLRVPALYGLLLHHPADLRGASGEALHGVLRRIEDEGLASRTGVSVYSPQDLDFATAPDAVQAPASDAVQAPFPDLVQAPFNVLDRRILGPGLLAQFRQNGTEVHTRSAFLQGLLLMPASARPTYFARWSAVWERWHTWLEQANLSPLAATLGFALAQTATARVVVGVDTLVQLKEILEAANGPCPSVPDDLATDDEFLINPFRWPRA